MEMNILHSGPPQHIVVSDKLMNEENLGNQESEWVG
jgi:hypothetical protein